MKQPGISTLGALVALALSSSAVAAEPKGGNDPLAVQALHNFAACAAERTPQGAVKVLAMDFRTSEYQTALRRYAKGHNYCASHSDIRFAGVLFSGSLAEAMLVSHTGSEPLTDRLMRVAGIDFQARSESERISFCIIKQQPAALSPLFATDPATKGETEAIRPIIPVLQNCLTQDRKVVLNKPALRALLALAAYRMLTYPGVAVPTGN